MRNLKRVLSLSLASVMLLGMMVIGASAAPQGYPDVDDEDNVEAIDVLQQVEVMIGYPEDGGFHPDDPVTRAEMMVIMAKLLNLDYNYYATACPFTDVPDWAKGYVGAAYANKVAYGRGDGIFDPNSTVTPVEASAFLMRALGYFQYSNDYADGFELATVRQGTAINIFDGVSSSATEPMTRNQVAKMVLNTLESGMVQPDGNTINLTTPDGSVLTGKVNYVYVTSNKDYASAIKTTRATSMGSYNDSTIVELGEQLYNGDLKLYDPRVDAFGRPSRHWEYKGESIGTYIKKDLLRETYTKKVTGKALYELLGSDVIKDYKFTITIDGETEEAVLNSVSSTLKSQYYFNTTAMNRTNTNQVGGTGNGVLTQVFVDGNKKEVYIAIINTYLAKADSDYNERKNEASFTIWNLRQVKVNGVNALVKDKTEAYNQKVSGDEFDVANIKTDDIVLVRVAENEIKEIIAPDVINETEVSAFKTNSYVIAEGTQYDYASAARYDNETLETYWNTNMKNIVYRIYLDMYGYLIGIEVVEAEKQFVFLTGINNYTENLKDQSAIGNVIFLDGTSKNVTINMKDSKNAEGNTFGSGSNSWDNSPTNGGAGGIHPYSIRWDTGVSALMNTWCTYSVDENGVYTLKEVANTRYTIEDKGWNKVGQSHMGGTYINGGNVTYYINGDTNPKNGENTVTTGFTPYGVGAARDVGTLSYGVLNDGTNEAYVTIDKGHVSLDGVVNSTSYKKVYGNNDTIYLSAEVGYLNGTKTVLSDKEPDKHHSVIITGIDSVNTGVQNVDLKAYNAQAVVQNLLSGPEKTQANGGTYALNYMDVSEGVYTLFNNKGYVIAAVVVGAEDSASNSFAWVSSKNVTRESLVDGKWEYSRDVIIDGKPETLTEIETSGNTQPDIGKMTAEGDDMTGFWWYVRRKADGTVKDAIHIYANNGTKYTSIYDIDNDTQSGTTVLNQLFNWPGNAGADYHGVTKTAEGGTYTVRVTGNTLQVESNTGKVRGFAVNPEASIAVVKDERIYRGSNAQDEWNWKEDIEYFTNDANAGGLQAAVNYLTNSKDFRGYISAILKDGRAECVVIYDKSDSEVDIGGANIADVVVYELGGVLQVTSSRSLTNREIAEAIKAYLNDSNIVSVSYNVTGGAVVEYTGSVTVGYAVNLRMNRAVAQVAGAEILGKVQTGIGSAMSSNGYVISADSNVVYIAEYERDYSGTSLSNYLNRTDGYGADGDVKAIVDGIHSNGAKEIKLGLVAYKWDADKKGWYNGSANLVDDIQAALQGIYSGAAQAYGIHYNEHIILTVDDAAYVGIGFWYYY